MTAELIALPPDDVLQQALQDAPAQADLLAALLAQEIETLKQRDMAAFEALPAPGKRVTLLTGIFSPNGKVISHRCLSIEHCTRASSTSINTSSMVSPIASTSILSAEVREERFLDVREERVMIYCEYTILLSFLL